eukprot:GHVP01001339.1.p1 GENE.GHVP01001339.1~~GHVP01001339.1.p1  ORF type:complete len:158 (-),score=34.88 GHVP01001339.1:899-1372(-)
MARTSATVLDLGHSRSSSVLIHDSAIVKETLAEEPSLGGEALTEMLKKIIFQKEGQPSSFEEICPPLFEHSARKKRKTEYFESWFQERILGESSPSSASPNPGVFLTKSFTLWSQNQAMELFRELNFVIKPEIPITSQEIELHSENRYKFRFAILHF